MPFPVVSAVDLLQQKESTCYSTGSDELDEILGGGVTCNSILQIAGPPGSGREQVVASIAHSALKAGYQILSYIIHGSDSSGWTGSLTMQEHSRLHCFYVTSLTELFLKLNRAEVFANRNPNTRFLIIDGMSSLIDDLPRDSLRKGYLKKLGYFMMRLSSIHNLTILLSTNVATKLLSEDGAMGSYDTGSKAILVPSLGAHDLIFNGKRVLLLRKTWNSSEARHIRSGGRFHSTAIVRLACDSGTWVSYR